MKLAKHLLNIKASLQASLAPSAAKGAAKPLQRACLSFREAVETHLCREGQPTALRRLLSSPYYPRAPKGPRRKEKSREEAWLKDMRGLLGRCQPRKASRTSVTSCTGNSQILRATRAGSHRASAEYFCHESHGGRHGACTSICWGPNGSCAREMHGKKIRSWLRISL